MDISDRFNKAVDFFEMISHYYISAIAMRYFVMKCVLKRPRKNFPVIITSSINKWAILKEKVAIIIDWYVLVDQLEELQNEFHLQATTKKVTRIFHVLENIVMLHHIILICFTLKVNISIFVLSPQRKKNYLFGWRLQKGCCHLLSQSEELPRMVFWSIQCSTEWWFVSFRTVRCNSWGWWGACRYVLESNADVFHVWWPIQICSRGCLSPSSN